MCHKIFALVFIIIAVALAISASILSHDHLVNIIYVSRFFDVMIPVLAVGALIKYLCTKRGCGVCKSTKQSSS